MINISDDLITHSIPGTDWYHPGRSANIIFEKDKILATFGEIHPNYFQIPVADREALIEAEADIEEEHNTENEENEEPLVLTEEKSLTSNKDEPLVLTKEIPGKQKIISEKVLSPAVRKIVEENKIDIQSIKGTGKSGQILKGDLISLMGSSPQPSERKLKYGEEERIKMSRLRQTIAKRLKEAQENAAMLTTFNEVDMTNIIEMRKNNQEDFQKRFGIKLGFMSFFVKACVLGLKAFPAINAEIEGQEIIYKNYYNISFAVGTDRGLVVPVLRETDEMSFADIEKNIGE